jgi:hypothetical protein
VSLDSSCVLLRSMCSTGGGCVTPDSSRVLLQWMCSTRGGCVTPDSNCVLLQWMCSTSIDCVSKDNRCVLLGIHFDLLDDIIVVVLCWLIVIDIARLLDVVVCVTT